MYCYVARSRLPLLVEFGDAMNKDRLYYLGRAEGGFIITSMIVLVVLVCLLMASIWYYEKQKAYYDAEVNRLCADDGGVKVYETVRLPSEKFNGWGQIAFYDPTQGANALGSEYIYKRESHYLRNELPMILRTHYEVIRQADNKLLGETTFYSREGGDFFNQLGFPPGTFSQSYNCPTITEAGGLNLLKQVFVKSE